MVASKQVPMKVLSFSHYLIGSKNQVLLLETLAIEAIIMHFLPNASSGTNK